MPSRVAEEKFGNIRVYGYPDLSKLSVDQFDWLKGFLKGDGGRYVLYGWQSVKEGLVKSFKAGRVKHSISRVPLVDIDASDRPRVEILCSLNQYFVFNWNCEEKIKQNPVVLLTTEQSQYFRLCERCSLVLEKKKNEEILSKYNRLRKT